MRSLLTPDTRSNAPTTATRALLVAVVALCAVALAASPALAQKKKKKRRGKRGTTIEAPINVGVGPAAYFFNPGPVGEDQSPHYGIQISIAAVLDKRAIRKAKRKVPKKYRKLIGRQSEMRISHALIPDSLIISPRTQNTGMYGITFRPLALGIPLIRKPVRLHLGTGLRLTYAYIHTEYDSPTTAANAASRPLAEGETHFFRPGLDLRADLEIPFSKTFLMSVGWTSAAYIPQQVHGGDFWSLGDEDQRVWHIGQAYLMLHFRFPYKTRL